MDLGIGLGEKSPRDALERPFVVVPVGAVRAGDERGVRFADVHRRLKRKA